MRRKTLLARSVCLCLLLLFCLFSFSPFRNCEDKAPEQAVEAEQMPAPAVGSYEDRAPEQAVEAEQTPAPAVGSYEDRTPEQTYTAAERLMTEQELLEIEIPFETDTAEDGTPQNPAAPPPTPLNSAVLAPGSEADNSGWNDVQINNNGDILLPEAP